LNPAPDADYHSVGAANFEWVVNAVADLAVREPAAFKAIVAEAQAALKG
jgi:ribosomal protein L20